jgi:hypothetical protein
MRCDGVKFDKVEDFSNLHGQTVSGLFDRLDFEGENTKLNSKRR